MAQGLSISIMQTVTGLKSLKSVSHDQEERRVIASFTFYKAKSVFQRVQYKQYKAKEEKYEIDSQ